MIDPQKLGLISDLTLEDLASITDVLNQLGISIDFDLDAAFADTAGGGQAPNNIANRNAPAYVARAQYASGGFTDLLHSTFPGITRIGQWRGINVLPGGGRAENSDHYSGGALDVYADPATMAAIYAWAFTQPDVSFPKFGDADHRDHVHISLKLGAGTFEEEVIAPTVVGVGGVEDTVQPPTGGPS